MSLPWTTMLSFDFLRSRVSISGRRVLVDRFSDMRENITIATRIQVDNTTDAYVYHPKKALVLLLELLLVEYLHCQDAVFGHSPAHYISAVAVMVGVNAGC